MHSRSMSGSHVQASLIRMNGSSGIEASAPYKFRAANMNGNSGIEASAPYKFRADNIRKLEATYLELLPAQPRVSYRWVMIRRAIYRC
jgi:hypothetical protein